MVLRGPEFAREKGEFVEASETNGVESAAAADAAIDLYAREELIARRERTEQAIRRAVAGEAS